MQVFEESKGRKAWKSLKNFLLKNLTAIFLIVASIAVTFTITFLTCARVYSAQVQALNESGVDIMKLTGVARLYQQKYVGGELSKEDMTDGTMYGLVAGTGDKYGAYFNKEEFESYITSAQGDSVGIGVNVVYKPEENIVRIVSVMDGSPAQAAGILPGDNIVGLGEQTLEELGYNGLVNNILGDEGTEVTVRIGRGEETLTFTMVRAKIEVQSVKYELLPAGMAAPIAPAEGEDAAPSPATTGTATDAQSMVGYISISTFNQKTTQQFEDAIKAVTGTEGLTGIVFDVRNNTGGDAMVIKEVLDMILPEGDIYKLVDKAGNENNYTSDAHTYLPVGMPVTVLCNANTASAAELFTAALQDYKLATVVGQTTFGKGTGVQVFSLADGSGLLMSDTLYYTPSGRNLEGVGVTPDVPLEMSNEEMQNFYEMTHESDPQLMKAMELMRS